MSKKNPPRTAISTQAPRAKAPARPPLVVDKVEEAAAPLPAQPFKFTLGTMLKPLASLRLTVVLLLLSMGLVLFGTLAQVDNGVWTVVDRYFWSIFVWVPAQIFVPRSIKIPTWICFPYPGGKLVGFLLLVNLLAAHGTRFKISWRRTGIWLIHGGLILLLVGEVVTRTRAREYRMAIDEGK